MFRSTICIARFVYLRYMYVYSMTPEGADYRSRDRWVALNVWFAENIAGLEFDFWYTLVRCVSLRLPFARAAFVFDDLYGLAQFD